MENAAKALQMAAGVLISVMVLTLVVIGYNNLSATKRIEQDIEGREQAVNFNKQFDSYNKKLYGSELIALANLIEDYNKRYPVSEGYYQIDPINSTTLGLASTDFPYYVGSKGTGSLANRNHQLETQISSVGNNKIKFTINSEEYIYTIKKLDATNDRILNALPWSASEAINTAANPWVGEAYTNSVAVLIPYRKLLTEQKDFARTLFKKVEFEYDDATGKVKHIAVSEN